MKHVVITGVSSGIGYDAARELIEHGWHVFGSVRQKADGERVRKSLGDHFTPLYFDVTDQAAVRAAADQVGAVVGAEVLAGLVNNAGVAIPGPLMHIELEQVRRQLEINVIGVVAVTQAFLPLLGTQKGFRGRPGRIVNISSVSGEVAYPFFGPYAMSKHALEAFSHCLRREMMLYGIAVSIIGPGSVKTPIWDKTAAIDIEPWQATDFGPILARLKDTLPARRERGLSVAATSAAIRHALESPRPKVRYPLSKRPLTGWLLPRYLPWRFLDRLTAKRLGIHRR